MEIDTKNTTEIESQKYNPKFNLFLQWREWAAYIFLSICTYDFIIAPLFNQIMVAFFKLQYVPWQPLTLQSGGIFFMSFGVILGVSAWGKSTENTEIIKNMPDYSNQHQ